MHFGQRVFAALLVSLCFVVWAQRETIGAWTVFREFDPITDGNTSWMYVAAWDQPVEVGVNDSSLVVRCSEADGFLDVYVILDLDQARLAPNEHYNATYRMGKGELHEVRGHASTTGEALFLADSDFGIFVAEAVTASNFAIRIWDDEGEALTYQMDISGFAEAYAHTGFGDTCLGAPDLSDPAAQEQDQEWESVGAWRVARRIDPITDENTSAMLSPAWDLPAGIELGDSALFVTCDEDIGIFGVSVLLDDQERLAPFTGDEYYDATYRMDEGGLHEVRGSSNGKAFHFFIADREGTWERGARTFVREAVDAENFTFRIRDDRGILLTYQMDITGFAEAYEYAGFDCLFAPDLATIPQTYILDALVEPDNRSLVTLFVLESPEDSKFTPGSRLGYVPGKISFDQPGTWRLEGRIQDLRSPEIVITIPDDRSFTVKIPAYAGIGKWQWIKQVTSNGSIHYSRGWVTVADSTGDRSRQLTAVAVAGKCRGGACTVSYR